MELRLNPLDTLFFRDGKPFAMGEETWADGLFPPNPSVIYGAIRTAFACIEGKEIPFADVKAKLGAGVLSVTNILYSLENSFYLPMPLDLVELKSKTVTEKNLENINKEYQVEPLDIGSKKIITKKNKAFPLIYKQDFQQVESINDGLIDVSNLKSYLKANTSSLNVKRFKDYVVPEPKIGIGRDDTTRTSDEGKLFRTDMKRLKDLNIRVHLNTESYENAFSNALFVKLGGEGKLIEMIKPLRQNKVISSENIKITNNKFKIYLATPAIFIKENWQPDLEKLGIKATLVSACIGKVQSIGGYDLIEGPKNMYKAIPAGSVYYYETENDVTAIIENLQGKSISDEYEEQGFGIAYFGNY